MHRLVQQNLIKVNDHPNYEELSFKTPWYNEKDLCEFHKIKGHTPNNCMRLKHIIQDLIEKEEVDVEHHPGNKDLQIYTNPILNHAKNNEKGKD